MPNSPPSSPPQSRRSEALPSANKHLDSAVRDRVEALDRETCMEWGGVWTEGGAVITELPIETPHYEKTVVESVEDARQAFNQYTEFFEHVLMDHEAESESVVLLPCGKTKPIGTSAIHRKKLAALEQSGLSDRADIAVMSEPCTIIPHDLRLSLPAVNYEFPPKFTEHDRAIRVFDVFADRLAIWLEERGYETVYPYLVERHQNKFEAALERSSADPEVVEVPGASLNPETGNYTGDVFKSTEDIVAKIQHTRVLRGNEGEELIEGYSGDVTEFYVDKLKSSGV